MARVAATRAAETAIAAYARRLGSGSRLGPGFDSPRLHCLASAGLSSHAKAGPFGVCLYGIRPGVGRSKTEKGPGRARVADETEVNRMWKTRTFVRSPSSDIM